MNNLTVSHFPHIRDRATTNRIMLDVVIALIPALIVSVAVFGARAALIVCVCVISSVASEWIFRKAMKKPDTIRDFSAVITGLLLAFSLPVGIPVWQAVFGSVVAIILVKQLFGGLGKNFANPAATARIILFLAFSVEMTAFTGPDAITGATPLAAIAGGGTLPSLTDMLLGVRGGCLGETSVLALVIGGIYLLARRVITWQAPVTFITTVFVFSAVLGQQPVWQILSGGLLLGAIFMATDYVTTPITAWGKVIFGVGAGFFTVVIRVYGAYPEGVSFAILLMNIITPYINRLTARRPFGRSKV